MPLQYVYKDALLKAKVTEEIEARAAEEVAADGEFTFTNSDGAEVTFHTERLRKIRTYIIVGLECATGPAGNDPYAAKVATYRDEYKSALAAARIAVQSNQTPQVGTWGFMTIKLERA